MIQGKGFFSGFFICVIFYISCQTICACKSQNNRRDFSKFPIEEKISPKNVLKISNVDGLLLYRDSILICRIDASYSNTQLRIVNLNNYRKYIDFLPTSRIDGDGVIGFLSYGLYKNIFWAHDIIKEQFDMVDIDKVLKGEKDPKKYLKVIPFNSNYYWDALIDTDKIVSFGDYDSDYKLGFYNINKLKYISYKLPYGKNQDISRSQKNSYESFLFTKPDFSRFVIPSRYSDLIEIYDQTKDSSFVIRGPEGFKPMISILNGTDGKELAARNEQTRFAFVKGKTTNEYIYLLYSGNLHNSEFHDYGRYIYVYDWNGHPVKKLILPNYINDFVVFSDNNILYGYNPKTKLIEKYNIVVHEK